MTLNTYNNHYELSNTDLQNELGYDLLERGAVLGAAQMQKKTTRFLRDLSNVVYGVIEQREEKEYLVAKFNEDTTFVLDQLILQFEYWENSEVDIFQSPIVGLCPLVEQNLRNKGLLFEGRIIK